MLFRRWGSSSLRALRSFWYLVLSLRSSPFRRSQALVFFLTYCCYASFYLTRKPFSIVKTQLVNEGLDLNALGVVDTFYLGAYAIGQFLNGALCDRVGPRVLLSGGLFFSFLFTALFGLSGYLPIGSVGHAVLFSILWGGNGYAQSSGWPGNVKVLTPWFEADSRGTVMGFWSSCYQIGGLVGTALAAFLLQHSGWKSTFFVPAALVLVMAVLILVFLKPTPEGDGLRDEGAIEEGVRTQEGMQMQEKLLGEGEPTPEEPSPSPSFWQVVRLPGLLNFGAAYFCLKLIRYALLLWLPFYLNVSLGVPQGTAGYLSTFFELGGVVGVIVTGIVSDRFVGKRVVVAAPMVLLISLTLLLYLGLGRLGLFFNGLSLFFIGVVLFAPDSLLSGAVAQDLGGKQSAGTAAGIVNGMGSVGATLQGVVVASLAKHLGWNAVFYFLMVLSVVGFLVLVPVLLRVRRQKGDEGDVAVSS